MIREGRMFGFAPGLLAACLLAAPLQATAGDKPREAASKTTAPLEIPHGNGDVVDGLDAASYFCNHEVSPRSNLRVR